MTSVSTSSEFATTTPAPQVELHQTEFNSLPEQQPPKLAERGWLHGRSPSRGPINVIAHQAALIQIVSHSESNRQVEVGGAMVGSVYQFKGEIFVEIEAVLPAVSGDHGPSHFTFSADSWAQLQRDRASEYPQLEIVGWFHTHPGLGVFYSGDDVIVHSAAFTLPWHVGLVLDPVRNEAGFFGWSSGGITPLPGFYELLESETQAVVDWQMVRTSVWNESYQDRLEEERSIVSDWQQSRHGRWGLIVGSLGLILGFFLLVGWVVPLTRQVQQLEALSLSLADATLTKNAAACPDPNLRILIPEADGTIKSGSEVTVMGTADHSDAFRYRVEVRPVGTEPWTLINAQRQDKTLGSLATWDTTPHLPATYEMRLTAVDRNNVRLVNTALCLISFELR